MTFSDLVTIAPLVAAVLVTAVVLVVDLVRPAEGGRRRPASDEGQQAHHGEATEARHEDRPAPAGPGEIGDEDDRGHGHGTDERRDRDEV